MSNKVEKGDLFTYFVYPFILVAFSFFIGDLYFKGNLKSALIDTGKMLLLSVWGFILFLAVLFFILLFIAVLVENDYNFSEISFKGKGFFHEKS